jgi:outer membrane protein OmpA-like peptidoglycan-associated protein
MFGKQLAVAGAVGLLASCLLGQGQQGSRSAQSSSSSSTAQSGASAGRGRRAARRGRAESDAASGIQASRDRRFPTRIGFVQTPANKNDWEDINFEFNSSIISDGFPTLLWLADFFKTNPDYRLRITGHTDYVGSANYNERLALARATAVRDFLVKYGAGPNQIQVDGQGKRSPEVANSSKEGRFVNRRVVLTVTDANGKQMSLEDLIKSQVTPKKQTECCDDILKRLDRLNDVLAALNDLKKQNEDLNNRLNALEGNQKALQGDVAQRPTKTETTDIVRSEGKNIAENAANQGFEKGVRNNRKFSLLALNIGPTLGPGGTGRTGNFTFSGKGRFFSPFGNGQLPGAMGTHAVQAEGEYMYYPGRQEGQFDIGLLNRWNRIQAGLFGSFKYVNFRDFQSGGSLGQGAFVVDYLFSRGRVGIFGTKGFKDNAVLNRAQLGPSSYIETYLKIVDQVGGSAQVGLWGDTYIEGNLGYLKRHAPGLSDRPGGMLKLVQPLSSRFAVTAEAGLNETFLNTKDSGRIVFGFEFGNWLRPKQYLETTQPVPMDIPRVRYELLTRRIGNSAPIAVVADQIGAAPGTITLDGSGSYDPEGDTLTFAWQQIAGPAVSISGANTAKATFTGAAGNSYGFLLTVTDPGGMKGVARNTVTVGQGTQVRILTFTANPNVVNSGQPATLVWDVENAETVTISGIGPVAPHGSSTVSPTQTTVYQLTAKNKSSEQNQTATVTVQQQSGRVVSFTATPVNINAGEASTLSWQTENITSVTISGGVGQVQPTGSTTVTPSQTTTYTLTGQGASGTVTATVTVQVNASGPRIVSFQANPIEILPTESSTLTWDVEGAKQVSISGIGNVNPTGSSAVSPQTTTTYTLTATDNGGKTTTATAVVTVDQPVRILDFVATPSVSPGSGSAVTLSWKTENATSVIITGVGPVQPNGTVQVKPAADVSYTLLAYGKRTQASAFVLVKVTGATTQGPVADAGPNRTLYNTQFSLNGTGSFSPAGLPLTYAWRFVSGPGAAAIDNPGSATPNVTVTGSFGEYIFELTVTDTKGLSSKAYVRIRFDP